MNSELSRVGALVDDDGTSHLAEYTYVGRERTAQVDFAQPGAKFTWIKQGSEPDGDGGDQYTGWDRFGRAIDLRWIKNSSGAELERLQHGYDRADNRLYRKNLVASGSAKQDELYSYDGLSQLTDFQRGLLNSGRTAMTGTLAAEEEFVFDPTGNWNEYVVNAGTPQTRTHNKANELTQINSSSSLVAEDAAGNMTRVPQPGSWSAAYDLKYDAWNRLVEVKDGSTTVATYRYDGLNRRITKTTGGDTRHFYYTDRWQIIEERLNTSTTADRQFVWGIRYIDDLVLRDRDTDNNGSLDERLYVIQDYFQPTAVMDISGVVQERYGYSAFGTTRVMDASFADRTSGSDYEWETRFGAYRWDEETGLLQVRNRYLHSGLGRWVTRDPNEYGDTTNLYAYAQNSPVNLIDFDGLRPCTTSEKGECITLCTSKGFLHGRCVVSVKPSTTIELILCHCTDCTQAQQAALQAVVTSACSGGACSNTDNCDTLSANYYINKACAAARDAINKKCFKGGDSGHQKAADNARAAATNCACLWVKKKCGMNI